MDVLLVKPVNYSHQIVPPLGLGYLATALSRNGHRVALLDCIKERMDFDRFEQYLRKHPADMVGFQTFSCDLKNVARQAEIAKRVRPGIVTVAGGPHPSALPEQTVRENPALDFALAGEAETGLPMLAAELENGRMGFEHVPGLVWRNEHAVRCNAPALVDDLDSLGFPMWELIDPRDYPVAVSGFFYKNAPIAPIVTTRGCPHLCTFCGGRAVSGRKLRRRSPGNVIREIEMLKADYGVREFQILDDNFTASRKFVSEICTELIERKLNMTWCLPNGVRIDTLNDDLLTLMRKAGCYEFAVGIESGSQRVLDHMKKHLTLEQIERGVSMVSRHGINVNGFFITGYPWGDEDDIRKTIEFACKLDLRRANFTNFLPLPGTESTRLLMEEGRLNDVDWSEMFYAKTAFAPPGMTKAELKRWQRRAFLRFYLRPRQIIAMISDVQSLSHLKVVVRRSLDFLFMR
jgi:anaerobic magnesium-protoporphyrin IX monomethyl ester cyclase